MVMSSDEFISYCRNAGVNIISVEHRLIRPVHSFLGDDISISDGVFGHIEQVVVSALYRVGVMLLSRLRLPEEESMFPNVGHKDWYGDIEDTDSWKRSDSLSLQYKYLAIDNSNRDKWQ
jgi:hypothetical protein